jgi:protein involved in polysaccharide export with SLBB domain
MYNRNDKVAMLARLGVGVLCAVMMVGCGSNKKLETSNDGGGGATDTQWVSPSAMSGTDTADESISVSNSIMQAGFRKSQDVILAPGDDLEVKFYYTPELDVTQVVRPDGNISLLLVGEVQVSGKTPAALTDELIRWYKPHLKDPHIAVIVRSLYNRRVFVSGKVTTPGIVEMPSTMTLMEAIMEAGGFDFTEADAKNVVVIRQKGGIRVACKIDMKSNLDGKTIHEPFYLQPQDVIFVPRSGIAKLDQWIEQYINKVVPRFFYLRYDPID